MKWKRNKTKQKNSRLLLFEIAIRSINNWALRSLPAALNHQSGQTFQIFYFYHVIERKLLAK